MSKRLNYQVGIEADTSQFTQQLNQALAALRNVSANSSNTLTKELREASLAAAELSTYLSQAVNTETGKFDLFDFNKSLKLSGHDLEYFKNTLQATGVQGQQAFLKVTQAITAAEIPTRRTSKLFDSLWVTMKNTMRWQLTSSMLHGFIGAMQTAVGYTKDLDKSLSSIRIVTQQSAEDMANFTKRANEAAKALSTTTTDYTNASLIYYQQGLTDEEVEARTNVTIKLANTAREDAETASEQLTAIWNNFSDGSDNLEHYADVLVKLGAETASSSDEIAQGMQKFAAVANTVGLSYEYAAAALATITAKTRESADVVGTALRTLFARIEGLQQGETLDDGVNLNKYSKALENVGVQVLDTSGNLKDMNTVLDELGEKWQNLSETQQVALAETVGGVRQYSQFMALMNNYDFFKENVGRANTATGTLQEQADIYAESWEAARDRVRAAAEDVYSSIIDPKAFTALDDAITPLLSTIAEVIKGMGGLPGILTTVSALLFQLFGDKMAAGIRTFGEQIGLSVGTAQSELRDLQERAVQLKNEMMERNAQHNTPYENMSAEIASQQADYQNLINEKIGSMNSLEKEKLRAQQESLNVLAQQTAEVIKQAETTQQVADEQEAILLTEKRQASETLKLAAQTNASHTRIGTGANGPKANKPEIEAYEQVNGILKGFKDEGISIPLFDDIGPIKTGANAISALLEKPEEAIDQLIEKLKELGETSSQIKQVQQGISRFSQEGQSEFSKLTPEVQKLLTESEQFSKLNLVNNGMIDTEQALQILSGELDKVNPKIGLVKDALSTMFGFDQSQLTAFISKMNNAGISLETARQVLQAYKEVQGEANTALKTGAYAATDFAQSIVALSSFLSQVGMALQAFKNIGRIFEDENLTDGERFIQILTSLGMLLPTVSNLFSQMSSVMGVHLVISKGVAKTEKEGAMAAAAKAVANKILAATENTVAAGASKVLAVFAGQLVAILPLVAIIGALTAVIWLLVKAHNAEADAAKRAAETAEQLKTRYDEIKNSYEELKESLSNYQSAKEGLDKLVKGTEEWKQAVFDLNQQVLELLKNYPELAKYVIRDENGVLSISEAGQDALLDMQAQRVESARQASLAADINNNEAQKRLKVSEQFNNGSSNMAYAYDMVSPTGGQIKVDLDVFLGRVIDAIRTYGPEILSDQGAVAEMLGGIDANSEGLWNLTQELIANKDKLMALSGDLNELDQSTKILSDQYGQSLLEENSMGEVAYAEQIASFIGDKVTAQAENETSNWSNKQFYEEYGNLRGWDYQGKGKYTGVGAPEDKISVDEAKVAVRSSKASEVAKEELPEIADAIADFANAAGTGSSENVKKGLANIAAGITDFSDLTQEEAQNLLDRATRGELNFSDGTLDALDMTEEQVKNIIAKTAENTNQAFDNITQGMSKKAADAFNEIEGIESKTLNEQEQVADVLQKAYAYGVLDEAVAAINVGKIDEFAESLNHLTDSILDNYGEIKKIAEDLTSMGDTISADDYEKLGSAAEGYFQKTIDGQYKLMTTADEFVDHINGLVDSEIAEQEQKTWNLAGYQDTYGGRDSRDLGNTVRVSYDYSRNFGAYGTVSTTLTDEGKEQLTWQIETIAALGDQSEETFAKVREWQDKIHEGWNFNAADLQEIAAMAGECAGAYDGLSGTIDENAQHLEELRRELALSFDNFDDLNEALEQGRIDLRAYNEAAIVLDEQLENQDLDAEELRDYTNYIQEAAEESEELRDGFAEDEDAAEDFAKSVIRMNKGVQELADNFEEWEEVLQDSSESSAEFMEAMDGCQSALSDLLGVNKDFISSSFVVNNLDLIREAANGSETAIDALRSALQDDIIAKIRVENGLNEEVLNSIIDIRNRAQQFFDENPNAVRIQLDPNDQNDFITACNNMIQNAGLTAAQVNALFGSMGYDVQFATSDQPVTNEIPVTTQMVEEVGYITPNIIDMSGPHKLFYPIVRSYPETHMEQVTGTVGTFAMSTDGSVPQIKSITKKATGGFNNFSSVNRGGSPARSSSGGGGSGGGSSAEPKQEEKEKTKTFEDIEDRYHEIDRSIQRQADLLDDLSDAEDRAYGLQRLKDYEKELKALEKQAENYAGRYSLAEHFVKEDQKTLKEMFPDIQFDEETGEILRYQDILEESLAGYNDWINNVYNSFIDKYNAASPAQQEAMQNDLEDLKKQKELKDEAFQARQKALTQYEESLDERQKSLDEWEEAQRQMADNELKQVTYKLEVYLEIKNAKDELREFSKDVAESLSDALYNQVYGPDAKFGKGTGFWGREQELADESVLQPLLDDYSGVMALFKDADEFDDKVAFKDEMLEIEGDALEAAQAIYDWIESLEDMLPDAIDAAMDRLGQFTDQLEHNGDVLSNLQELYELQGQTFKTDEGFKRLQKTTQEQLDAALANSVLNKQMNEVAERQLQDAQAAFDALLMEYGGDQIAAEGDIRYDTLKANLDASLEMFNETQEAMYESAKEAMELARDMYLQQVERAVYDFGQELSGGIGLDSLQEQYDHLIEKEHRYFDQVNEAYYTASWYDKLQADIDKTQNSMFRDRLKDLQEEIDIRREGGKLSQYDLDILEAKYKVLQAQMALEDAENNKSELRLVRDRQGNWNYQYTANPDDLANKQQELLDAENEWYNLAKEQVEDVTGQIIDTWQECADKIKDVYSDMTLTDEERAQKAQEIYEEYCDKVKYLEEEKQVAMQDMVEGGNQEMFHLALDLYNGGVATAEEIEGMTGLSTKAIEELIKASGMSIQGLLTMDWESMVGMTDAYGNRIFDILKQQGIDIEGLMTDNAGQLAFFDQSFMKACEDMTKNAGDFDRFLGETLKNCNDSFTTYQGIVDSVATQTGTDLESLDTALDKTGEQTDELREKGEALIPVWEEMLTQVADLVNEYLDSAQAAKELANSLLEVAEAAAEAAKEMANAIKEAERKPSVNDIPSAAKPAQPQTQSSPSKQGNSGSSDTGGNNSASSESGYSGSGSKGRQASLTDAEAIWNYLVSWKFNHSLIWEKNGENLGNRYAKYRDKWSGSGDLLKDLNSSFTNMRNDFLGFASGGYTGEFDGAKLAFLHEKELVLNKQDTENILNAVAAVRQLGPSLFKIIEGLLDSQVTSNLGSLIDKYNISKNNLFPQELQQDVHIEASFPSVVDHNEIEEAFNSLINDAAQWVRRRTK